MPHPSDRLDFLARLRQARRDAYGDDDEGVARLAGDLGIPPGTWVNYEAGVIIPDTIMLRFVGLTGSDPRWLLTGDGRPRPARPVAAGQSD